MRICVPGGAGYVGSKLIPKLLECDYEVNVLDLFLYDENVFDAYESHPGFVQIKGDVRDLNAVEKSLQGCDAIVHLACISNDPSFELNPKLGKSINLDAFEPFVQLAKKQKVKRFIFASSSSVYGVKNEPHVTEDMSLEPLTDYSKFKAECEKILFKYMSDDFICTVLRPATVCGYAPRQRLDVVVNILTNLAFHTGVVKVMGGSQMRPNIHIEDMVRAYLHVLRSPAGAIQGEIFNVGSDNFTVLEIGEMVQAVVSKKRPVDLIVEPTNDLRSYHVSSQKIALKLGFSPQYTVEGAIQDLVQAFETDKLPNALEDMRYYNIKTMKAAALK